MEQLQTDNLSSLVAKLTPNQLASAAGKNLARRLVQTSLEAWCRFVLRPKQEQPAQHHKLLISLLQAITNGTGPKKVIVLMPPGAAKSTYISVCFPPWYLNQHPQHLILACSYSYTLIEGFGRQCRDLIDEYHNELGYTLSKTAAAAGDWRVNKGGGYFCGGVGAGIAGHRADLGFIDDYLGNEEDADSQVLRDKIYNWYRRDFVPRLKPNATRIIVANRRHEDDLVGRLLETEAKEWHVVRLPMVAEDQDPLGRQQGELLWPEWFTQDMVTEAKKDPRTWAGLYQQRPAPEEGNYFKKDGIVEYRPDDLPKNLRYYVGSDYALRKDDLNDRTCFLAAGVDEQDRMWILPDWFWTRCDTGEAVEAMLDMAARRRPICWWAGRENITGSIGPFLLKRMRERNVYIPIEELSEGKNKEQKAQGIKARMSAKMVMFPSYAPNWADALNELLTFPGGKHDDFVDALAKLGMGLDKMVPADRIKAQWGGIIPDQPLTCGWLKKSSKRRDRRMRVGVFD